MYPLCNQRKWGDPVRVKALYNSHSKRVDGHFVPEYRRFSLDPVLTSFEILHSLISRAFDIQSEFLIQYRIEDSTGQEVFLQLTSDWDLEAAFKRASDPYLHLRIDPIPFEHVEEWDLINTIPSNPRVSQPKETTMANSFSIQTNKIFNKMEKTISLMQQALNLHTNNGEFAIGSSKSPMSDVEFRDYRDGVGTLINMEKCRERIFQGGIEPSLRRVLWKHLLNVYPEGLNGSERIRYMYKKNEEYNKLKADWMLHYTSKKMPDDLQHTTSMVRKDVLRTDRQHPFYSGGDDHHNVEQLFNILTTYAVTHPTTGYCQGMSDLASPILFVMGCESHAYIAFTALMERLKDNFSTDGVTMTKKFDHLSSALAFYDPVFFAYLKRQHASDLLFCYRWLLLEMKREFSFDDALRMLEVTWSSLAFKHRQAELQLSEQPSEICAGVPFSPPAIVRTEDTPYEKVCALRRQSVSPTSSLSSSPIADLVLHGRTCEHNAHSEEACGLTAMSSSLNVDSFNSKKRENGLDEMSNDSGQTEGSCETSDEIVDDSTHVFYEVSSLPKIFFPEENVDKGSIINDFEVVSSCEEAALLVIQSTKDNASSSDHIKATKRPSLPSPDDLGCGNPFLIFLCVTVLMQHRDTIMAKSLDGNEIAMHFDRLVRRHNVERVLSQARTLYYRYLSHFQN